MWSALIILRRISDSSNRKKTPWAQRMAQWLVEALQGVLPEAVVGAALRRDTELISPPGVGGGRG